MDLVILAAGMGSRFGGLKQIEPIDPKGNFIIDYSIYDAKKAGFDRVVFIIKEENREIFEETVGKRVAPYMEVAYAYQSLDVIPAGYVLPEGRKKPLGTAQAIYCAKDVIRGDFAIINSDDFYGSDAFRVAAEHLRSMKKGIKGEYANIAYKAINTITENGSVKRGVLHFDDKNMLTSLVESKLEKKDGRLYATPLAGGETKSIADDTLVSMNMFVFTKDILDRIREGYVPFLEASKEHLDDCEYLIPDLVSELVEKKKVTCRILSTSAVWYGVTYRADKEEVVEALAKLVAKGEYPKDRFGA